MTVWNYGAGGNMASIARYDEYGIPASTNPGRFQYTGQMWLPEIGVYYYKARFYSPTSGRLLQTDPIGYGDGMNMYAYVGNDPVNKVDPSGLGGKPAAHCTSDRGGDCGRAAGKQQEEEAQKKAREAAEAVIITGRRLSLDNRLRSNTQFAQNELANRGPIPPTTFPTTPRQIWEAVAGPDDPKAVEQSEKKLEEGHKTCQDRAASADAAGDAIDAAGAGLDLAEKGNGREAKIKRGGGRLTILTILLKGLQCR